MVNASAYFDLYTLFVSEIVGGLELFLILGVIGIFIAARGFKFAYHAAMLMSILFVSIVVATTYNPAWWALTLLMVGIIFYMAVTKKLK